MISSTAKFNIVVPSREIHLKVKLALYLLLILGFWNIIYNILAILSHYFAKVPDTINYYLSMGSMIFVAFMSALAYAFYLKRRKIAHILHFKLTGEAIVATFYFLIINFFSFYPKYYPDLEIRHQDYILNFITLVILNNILLILIKSFKFKVIMVLFFTGVWSYHLTCSNSFQNQIELIKLIIQVFTNLSLIIMILYYEKKHKIFNGQSENENLFKRKITKKKTLVKGNKVLFKFLNSLNSGILLYDKDMELLFSNKRIKKFIYQNIENKLEISQLCNFQQKNSLDTIRQKLNKLKNIKCFLPEEEKEIIQAKEIDSSLKSIIHSLSNLNYSGYLPKDLSSELTFKALLQLIKIIWSDELNPLHATLNEHYLLFHYILNNSSSTLEILQESDEIVQSFSLNPQKKYNEIRISCIDYQETCLILFEFTDETDRKRLTELNTINEHKNKILSHVAHEFRTPLNSIIGNLELVQDLNEIPFKIKEDHLKPALFSSTLLLNYINDILDFSQLRSEKLKMNYIKFNLPNHITTISKIMEILALKKGIYFEKHIDQNLPALITSDPNRLTQILLNLLSNAFKFTLPAGSVILKINFEKENKMIRFEISDNGIGISEENMKKLFKEFGKISSDQNSILNPSGVGLGLIISQKFAEEMGPNEKKGFQVKSEIGKGTSFTFYLEDKNKDYQASSDRSSKLVANKYSSNMESESLDAKELEVKNKNLEDYLQKKLILHFGKAETHRSLTMSSKVIEQFNSGSQGKHFTPTLLDLKCFPFSSCQCPKILVVDDDMFNVSYLQNVLKLLGYSSEFVFNGENAVKIMESRLEKKCCEKCKRFRIIFMDSEMPGMNGLEATAIIKQMSVNNKVVIIGCTGNTACNDLNKFKMAGADVVCTKPIHKAKIMSILEFYKDFLDE